VVGLDDYQPVACWRKAHFRVTLCLKLWQQPHLLSIPRTGRSLAMGWTPKFGDISISCRSFAWDLAKRGVMPSFSALKVDPLYVMLLYANSCSQWHPRERGRTYGQDRRRRPPPLATERFDYRSRAGFQKLIVLIIIARPSQCWNLELGVIAMATV